MDRTPLLVLFAIAWLLPTTLHAQDATAPATQARSAAASPGLLFDTLASRYGVRGDDEIADEAAQKARIVELTHALPPNDPVRSARLDAYRCITLLDGPDASLSRAETGLAGRPAQREPLVRMEYLMCKAYALFDQGNRTDYIVPVNEVLRLADRRRYPRLRSGALFLRSFNESDQGRYAQALTTLREVLALDRTREAPNATLRTEVMIANTFIDLGFNERAIAVLRALEKNARAGGQSGPLQMVLERLGQAEEQSGRLDAALANYREAAGLARSQGGHDSHASLMLRIAHVHVLAGRLDDARSAREEADRSLFRSGSTEAMRARRGYLDARIALESGDAGRAALLLPDVMQRLRDDDQPQPLVDALDVQARAYRELGQWRAALDAREEQIRLRTQLDQRMQREQARVLAAELALSRETADKLRLLRQTDAQRLQLQAAKREQRLRLIAIVLLALLLGAVAGLLLLTRHRLRGARYDAMTDSLTGVVSRRYLLDHLARMLSDRHGAALPLSVLAIDIDHFKQINDRFGHAVGDEALRRVTEACRRALRETDEFGRLGGEEFLAVLRRTSLAHAEHLGKRLCEVVAALTMDDVTPGLRVTISIGVAEAAVNDEGADKLLLRADAALYEAKNSGRNCVRVAPENQAGFRATRGG
ncbi:MAG: diguanylate cyclase [Lysobacter sp.]|nr:diguanylate cyclase [Lysobacter sp.]